MRDIIKDIIKDIYIYIYMISNLMISGLDELHKLDIIKGMRDDKGLSDVLGTSGTSGNHLRNVSNEIQHKRDLDFRIAIVVVRNVVVLTKNCDWSGKTKYLVIKVANIQTYRRIFRLFCNQWTFDR